ncbi:peroxide stress protein YaaA [Psychromarinibacter halotolerans]|uniref:UPF0246 protein ACFOGP_03740 n=1 Tax=Psychromarinibacter halotolerans TaxID=1775175 RepID=A0ABV7GNJ6_9RHOB|nr:peroxide stress protein YaaA [Psychromarinibacter halotolerans]MDF0595738.1 peroxide stress protein YaaA [Psychromarinibacter halotolerans]
MLAVISPAKRLDETPMDLTVATDPMFAKEAATLAGHMRQLSLGGLKDLMDLSDDLARLNRDRFRDFAASPEPQVTKPAVFLYSGDTYTGLEAATLDADALDYAQRHLRILSGLYGLLRPLDAIQPHRLEMGSRLKTRRGGNLYDYWRDLPAKALNAAAEEAGTDVLVNCASQEYFGAVDRKALKLQVVTPTFYELKKGEPKIVSFFAKKARGAMARFVMERRIDRVEGLADFDTGGYRFDADRSTPDQPVFIRAEADATDRAA